MNVMGQLSPIFSACIIAWQKLIVYITNMTIDSFCADIPAHMHAFYNFLHFFSPVSLNLTSQPSHKYVGLQKSSHLLKEKFSRDKLNGRAGRSTRKGESFGEHRSHNFQGKGESSRKLGEVLNLMKFSSS